MRSITLSNGLLVNVDMSFIPRGKRITCDVNEFHSIADVTIGSFIERLEQACYYSCEVANLVPLDYVDILSLWFDQQYNTKIDAYLKHTQTGGFFRFGCDSPAEPNVQNVFDATPGRGDYIFEKDSMPYDRRDLEVTEYKIYAFPTDRKVYENGVLVGYDKNGRKMKRNSSGD